MTTNTANHLNLSVHYDPDYEGWLVRQASSATYISQVPIYRIDHKGEKNQVHFHFETKREALEQVRRLNLWETKRGGIIEFGSYTTPGLFTAKHEPTYL